MNSKKIQAIILFIAFFSQLAVSQVNTNSPYTRFGYGDVTEITPVELKGMGGASIANFSGRVTNPVNPASYSSIDSLSFMFDLGASSRLSQFSADGVSNSTFNANLEYITMRFPIGKHLGFSAGLLPYSFVGYRFSQSDSTSIPVDPGQDPEKIGHTKLYGGSGGLFQVYSGLSLKLFNHVAVGANLYYMYGSINNYLSLQESNSPSTTTVYNGQIKASGVRFRYGLQAFNTFKNNQKVSLGFIYESKTKLNAEYQELLNANVLSTTKGFESPQLMGVGINYTLNDKLTLAVDYKQQSWSNSLFFGKTDSLVNSSTIAAGAEYIPNPLGNKITDRFYYRIGFNTSNPYYKVGNTSLPNNYSVSLGIGIPVRENFMNRYNYINASVEYGKMGSNSLLRENYFKFSLSTSFNGFWFFKRKL